MPAAIDERAVRQPPKVEIQGNWWMTAREGADVGEDDDPRVTPERQQLAGAAILHLSPIVGQITELWRAPEEDEYGRLRPTRYAFEESVRCLVDAAIEAYEQGRQIPFGRVSTDSEGGVRIEWIRPSASVHLVIPASKDGARYVYHEVANNYATDDATPERLAYWLRRIN